MFEEGFCTIGSIGRMNMSDSSQMISDNYLMHHYSPENVEYYTCDLEPIAETVNTILDNLGSAGNAALRRFRILTINSELQYYRNLLCDCFINKFKICHRESSICII